MRPPPSPPPIYAIADAETLAPRSLAEGAAEMAAAGVRWIQLRAKRLPDRVFYAEAAAACERVRGSGARLWIDDRADLAALLPVAGLHLGQRDLPPAAARAVVGGEVWIGRSTHDLEQLREADRDPEVDLVAFGPIFSTASKPDPDRMVGLEGLRRARPLTAKPLVAIGGIDAGNVAEVLACGADSAAMIGALCRGDVAANCRRLLRAAEPRRAV